MPFELETLYELHYQMITLGKVSPLLFSKHLPAEAMRLPPSWPCWHK
jgi:hypothetical protein